jgi:hypothetical protein
VAEAEARAPAAEARVRGAPRPVGSPVADRRRVAAAQRCRRMRAIAKASSSPAASSACPAADQAARTEAVEPRTPPGASRQAGARALRAARQRPAARQAPEAPRPPAGQRRAAEPQAQVAPRRPEARPAPAERPERAEAAEQVARSPATRASARGAAPFSGLGAARATRPAAVPPPRGCRTPAAELVRSGRNSIDRGIKSPGRPFHVPRAHVTAGCSKQANYRNKRTNCPKAIDAGQGVSGALRVYPSGEPVRTVWAAGGV